MAHIFCKFVILILNPSSNIFFEESFLFKKYPNPILTIQIVLQTRRRRGRRTYVVTSKRIMMLDVEPRYLLQGVDIVLVIGNYK